MQRRFSAFEAYQAANSPETLQESTPLGSLRNATRTIRSGERSSQPQIRVASQKCETHDTLDVLLVPDSTQQGLSEWTAEKCCVAVAVCHLPHSKERCRRKFLTSLQAQQDFSLIGCLTTKALK